MNNASNSGGSQFCGRTRREFLWETGGGFTATALAGMLGDSFFANQSLAADGQAKFESPLAVKKPHFKAKAKSVIFLFMTGGVSHVDTFDPKPRLKADVGKEVKADHPEIQDRPGYERIFLKAPQWEFSPYGQCGTEVSSLFPEVGCWLQFWQPGFASLSMLSHPTWQNGQPLSYAVSRYLLPSRSAFMDIVRWLKN